MQEHKYLINQRVIYGDEIGTVQRGATLVSGVPKPSHSNGYVWVFLPSKGYAMQIDERNVKPLPGGQL